MPGVLDPPKWSYDEPRGHKMCVFVVHNNVFLQLLVTFSLNHLVLNI